MGRSYNRSLPLNAYNLTEVSVFPLFLYNIFLGTISAKTGQSSGGFCGVVVITSALHAEGREFEPRQNLTIVFWILDSGGQELQ